MRFVLALGGAAAIALVAWLRPAAPAAAPGSWSTPPATQARVTAPARAVVYVAGAVLRPGVYALAPSARVADALARAGGARGDADLVAVNLAARIHDGDEIAVPVRGAQPVPRARRSAAPRRSGRRVRTPRRATLERTLEVDINRAAAAELAALPGVGSELARRIVAFRELNGPFDDPADLLDVAGVSEHRLAHIAPYVVVR